MGVRVELPEHHFAKFTEAIAAEAVIAERVFLRGALSSLGKRFWAGKSTPF